MIDRLFSLIKKDDDDQFYEEMVKDYFKINGLHYKGASEYYMAKIDSLDFSAYAVSKMPDYDLDCSIVWIGFARSSKSTGALHHARQVYRYWSKPYLSKNSPLNANSEKLHSLKAIDTELVKEQWVDKNVIYKREQGFEPLKYQRHSVIVLDDAILVSDRREAMNPQQVQFLKYLNRYAYNNNIVHALIQNLSDLDQRVYSKASLIFLVYERGSALMYAKHKNFPIMKDTFGFDWFYDNPWLLNNKVGGLHALKSVPEYVDEVHFDKLEGNALYDKYLIKKKTLEDENTLRFMEKMRYDGKCSTCQKQIAIGDSGYYDTETKMVYCVDHGKQLSDVKESSLKNSSDKIISTRPLKGWAAYWARKKSL